MRLEGLHENAEDAPLVAASMLTLHQLFGWRTYVLSYASGGSSSTPYAPIGKTFNKGLINPVACLFGLSRRFYIGLSTVGMIMTGDGTSTTMKPTTSLILQQLKALHPTPHALLRTIISPDDPVLNLIQHWRRSKTVPHTSKELPPACDLSSPVLLPIALDGLIVLRYWRQIDR